MKKPETPEEEARQSNRLMEAMYGDIRRDKGVPLGISIDDPVRKQRAARKPSGKPMERDILKAIMQLLQRHPKVARVWRQNSGTFSRQYKGKTHYIRANTAKGMADIMGVLKSGRSLAIEVKSPTGLVAAHQHEFLNSIATAGGLAFVARSVDDVIKKLEEV